jgi:hypothetical protein
MIALQPDCLVFRTPSGEGLPLSAEMLSAEMLGDSAQAFDPEFIRHAAKAVFFYFKYELGWQTVTVGEFAGALEKVLRGFTLECQVSGQGSAPRVQSAETDLCRLAEESDGGCELVFFPRLRTELRRHLEQAPRLVRFRGLRGCVKQLAGARRWNPRCRQLQDRIVDYLRQCLNAEPAKAAFALVIE